MSTTLEQDADQVPVHVDVETTELVGLLAEYTDVNTVTNAARSVRKAGYSRWDVHTPFPIHGIDPVMGIRPTGLPWLVLCGGLFGLFGGMWLQWYTNAHDYPVLISGKPFWSLPANIPVIFECTVLCSALTAVFGMLGLNRLPTLYNPLFKSDRFRRVTNDRFFIVIDASDSKFDEPSAMKLLTDSGAVAVERVED
jgi:ActD protein